MESGSACRASPDRPANRSSAVQLQASAALAHLTLGNTALGKLGGLGELGEYFQAAAHTGHTLQRGTLRRHKNTRVFAQIASAELHAGSACLCKTH